MTNTVEIKDLDLLIQAVEGAAVVPKPAAADEGKILVAGDAGEGEWIEAAVAPKPEAADEGKLLVAGDDGECEWVSAADIVEPLYSIRQARFNVPSTSGDVTVANFTGKIYDLVEVWGYVRPYTFTNFTKLAEYVGTGSATIRLIGITAGVTDGTTKVFTDRTVTFNNEYVIDVDGNALRIKDAQGASHTYNYLVKMELAIINIT